ncbi:MAG TPA: hypothetical protein VM529_25905, partial [Gemmata sp.]|nr:hypothetical protein [Gemmata sp.]
MDPLAFTPAELEELLADACRKAYRKGVKAATRKFDTLLSRHYRKHQLESLNGTTGEFVEEARQELKSLTVLKRRDATGHDHAADGKFAAKGGGGGKQNGNGVAPEEGAGAKDVAAKPGVGNPAPAQHDAPTEEHFLDGLHEVVPAGQWHKAKAAVVRAGQKVYERMVLATPAFLKLQHVLTAIEGPDDLKQFGYKPMFDGTAGHDTPDAFADATGVGGTLGAKLAAHVLAKAVFWLKDRAGLAKAMGGDHYGELS